MNALEQLAARPLGPLAAVERAAVHAGDHEADDMRFHVRLFDYEASFAMASRASFWICLR